LPTVRSETGAADLIAVTGLSRAKQTQNPPCQPGSAGSRISAMLGTVKFSPGGVTNPRIVPVLANNSNFGESFAA
jgi:hypothetical protein